jgi:hypothetical protein
MVDPAMKEKRFQIKSALTEPRRGMIGCLATKIEPSDFKDCAENYDNPEYQDISLIPTQALRQSVFRKTGNQLLAPSAKQGHINQLPSGLRAYILHHKQDYKDYIKEREAELELLRSVKKNLKKEQSSASAQGSPLRPPDVEPIEPELRPKRRR